MTQKIRLGLLSSLSMYILRPFMSILFLEVVFLIPTKYRHIECTELTPPDAIHKISLSPESFSRPARAFQAGSSTSSPTTSQAGAR